jgi:hypothetical protein
MAAIEISARKKSEFVQIQITKTESEKSKKNIIKTLVNNKRILKGCDVFKD